MNFCTITLKYKFLILILVGVFILKNTNAQESVLDSLMTVAENDTSSNPLSAIPVLQQAHRLAIEDDSFDDICRSTISLGLAYSTTGKYQESIILIDTFLLKYKDICKMFVKKHSLHKLKIRLYTKLVSNLTDCSLVLNSFSLKYPQNTSL